MSPFVLRYYEIEQALRARMAALGGWPLLVERRLIVDQDGRPLELTESRYAAGRYALEVDFVVEPQATAS